MTLNGVYDFLIVGVLDLLLVVEIIRYEGARGFMKLESRLIELVIPLTSNISLDRHIHGKPLAFFTPDILDASTKRLCVKVLNARIVGVYRSVTNEEWLGSVFRRNEVVQVGGSECCNRHDSSFKG